MQHAVSGGQINLRLDTDDNFSHLKMVFERRIAQAGGIEKRPA